MPHLRTAAAGLGSTEKLPKEIRGIEDMGRLYGALPESLADDVFYNNAYNFFGKNLGQVE